MLIARFALSGFAFSLCDEKVEVETSGVGNGLGEKAATYEKKVKKWKEILYHSQRRWK